MNEIRGALSIMNSAGFLESYKMYKFHVRFLQEQPPFTGVMIDGDSAGASPWTHGAQICVQPLRLYKTVDKGTILQFKYEKRERSSGRKGPT
jgi:hypothetical protein